MEKKELEEKLRGLIIFTEGDGQGQATNTTLEEELGEYAMQKVLDLFSQELDRAREEGRKERTDELKQAFHEVFYKSGELWFNYIFEDGDTKAEQEAKAVVEDYWDEIISKLRTK